MLELENPHSILAALEVRPQDVLGLRVPQGKRFPGVWKEILELAQKHGVRILEDRSLARIRARVRPRVPVTAFDLFSSGRPFEAKQVWLALEELQDPQNVGAIFRTAAFFGVRGVLLTQERSAPLTSTVYDVASGALEFLPFAIQTNLKHAFEIAQEAGVWILGTSEHALSPLSEVFQDRPWLVILGNEEKGMKPSTARHCDLLCRVPAKGRLGSLNVSVTSGIVLHALTS
jgi:23S rRNA (guanosine2251-2'-O)-methyltransferase